MAKSTKSKPSSKSKPGKPYPEFPLFPHATGRWAKKIRGKLHYFGSTRDDPEGAAAMERFNREWPYLKDGRTPPPIDTGDGCTLADLCNAFLTSKLNSMRSGELTERSFRDYRATTDRLIAHFGKDRRVDDLRPDDFEGLRASMAERLGPVSLKNEVNRARVVFKYADDNGLIDRPVRYGQSFNRPSAKALRRARNEAGPKLFEAHELRTILDALDGKPIDVDGEQVTLASDPAMKAMLLLGINGGFGNTDVASLPQSAVDLADGWLEFPRPKTEVERRIPLWPETVDALRAAIDCRPAAKDRADDGLCFLTATGRPWVRVTLKRGSDDPDQPEYVRADSLGVQFGKVLRALNINGRKGLGFYTMRHNFETIAGESRDQIAVNAIMGHVDSSMAGQYREGISDQRLTDVVNVVRDWLFVE